MGQSYKYHYFYRIVNTINGNYYYGIHSTNDLEDGYMGSGRRLKRAYKQFGKENFEKTILKFFKTRELASSYENEVVTEACVKNIACYNLKIGGDFGLTSGTILVKDENGIFLRVKPDDEDYLSGKYVPFANGMVSVFDNAENKYKLIPKEEYSGNEDRYVYASKGWVSVKDKDGNTKSVRIDDEEYLNGNLMPVWVGKKHSDETKRKMSETHRKNHHQEGEKNSQYGTCWITNGKENLKVKKSEVDAYVEKGWTKGRFIPDGSIKRTTDGIPKDEVLKYREEGLSWAKIAKIFNVSKTAMFDYKKRMEG